MKFDAILEYQKVDQELIALESEATSSKEVVNLYSARKNLENATATIGKLSTEANDIISGCQKADTKINNLKAKLDEFDGIIDGVEDVSEADYYLKQIESIINEISALEKDMNKEMSRVNGVYDEFKKTWDAGTKASEGFKQAKVEYDKYMANMKPKVSAIKEQLDALSKDIPPAIFELYKSMRDPKKMPVFVEYDASKRSCGRCRMEVPSDTFEKLRASGDYAECPNCRRIIYIP